MYFNLFPEILQLILPTLEIIVINVIVKITVPNAEKLKIESTCKCMNNDKQFDILTDGVVHLQLEHQKGLLLLMYLLMYIIYISLLIGKWKQAACRK